jgi:hypothetical protein
LRERNASGGYESIKNSGEIEEEEKQHLSVF